MVAKNNDWPSKMAKLCSTIESPVCSNALGWNWFIAIELIWKKSLTFEIRETISSSTTTADHSSQSHPQEEADKGQAQVVMSYHFELLPRTGHTLQTTTVCETNQQIPESTV